MALESEIYFDYGVNNAQKMMKVVDCRLVMDRDYDKHSPKSYMRLTRLDVTVSPDVDDMYLHKWFADKNSIDLLLKIALLNGKKEEYQSILLKGAACCGLTERIDKVNPKKEKRRRLLTVRILADKVTVNDLELKYYEMPERGRGGAEAREIQAPAQQQPAAQQRLTVESLIAQMPNTLTEGEKEAIAKHNIRLMNLERMPLGSPMPMKEARKTNPHFVRKNIKNEVHKKEKKEVTVRDPNTGKMVKRMKVYEPPYIKNPAFNEKEHMKYGINCVTCSITCALRQQGFKVTAKGRTKKDHTEMLSDEDNWSKVWLTPDGRQAEPTRVTDWMKTKHYDRMTGERYREFLEENTKEDGLYMYIVNWKGNEGEKPDGHATIMRRWTDKKGTHLENIETQTSQDSSLMELCGTTTPWPQSNCGIMRVDNKMFKPEYKDIFEYEH